MDLLVRGGTVVTAAGSRRADVLVSGSVISAVLSPEDGARAAEGVAEVVAAEGLLVLPGVVDVHTHTRVASDAEPDRFFQDTVAAAFGGNDHPARLQQPRDRVVARGRAIAPDRDPRVARGGRRATRPSTWRPASRSAGMPTIPSANWRRSSTRVCPRPRPSWSSTSGWRTGACSRPCGAWARRAACSRSIARTRSSSMPPWPKRSGWADSDRAIMPPVEPRKRRPLRRTGRWPSPRPPRHPSMSSISRRLQRWRRFGGRRLPASVPRPKPARITWSWAPIATTGRTTRRSAMSYRRHCGRRLIATRSGPAWPTARSTSSPPTTCRTGSRSRSGSRRRRSRRSATERRGSKRSSR